MDAFATQTSVALQYGVPLNVMVNKFSHMRFEPNGFTKNPELPIAKSIIDYIFRWLASRFLNIEEQDAVGIIRREPVAEEPAAQAEAAATKPEPTGNGNGELKVIAVNGNGYGTSSPTFAFRNTADAPSCSECGSLTVRSGSCYKCMNCGATTGCS
jgi:ribonucleoside-diphosphate reductase alpha chain